MQFTAILLCLSLWWLSEAALELPWHFKYHGVLFLFLSYDCLRQHSGTIIAFGIIYRYLDFICKSVYKLLYFYLVLKSGDCLRQHWYCTLYFTLEIQISCEGVFCFSAMTVWGSIVGKSFHLVLCTGILISLANQYAIYSNLSITLVTVWGSTGTAHCTCHCKCHGVLFLLSLLWLSEAT